MTELPRRELGRTGLMVTRLGYGGQELRSDAFGRLVTERQAKRVLNSVLDSGINFIDTSIEYGRSEERIGRYISHRRSEFVLATKCGCPLDNRHSWRETARGRLKRNLTSSAPWRLVRRFIPCPQKAPRVDRHFFTRENIIAGVEQSLRRMKTDYIDILQFHHAPPIAVLEKNGAIDAVLDLKRQGKVRFIGASASLPIIADYTSRDEFEVIQVPYSAFDLQHGNVIAEAAAAGTGTVIRAGIGGGGRGGLSKDAQVRDAWRRARLGNMASGMSPVAFNLRFTLANPEVDTVLIGTANLAHLEENVGALLKGPLSQDVTRDVTEALARLQ